MIRHRKIGILGLLAVVLLGCNDDPMPPATGIAMIEVTPTAPLLVKGDRVQFEAVARQSSGAVIQNAEILWRSTAPDTISVSSTGEVTVHELGSAWIVASSTDGVADSVRIATCDAMYPITGERLRLATGPGYFRNVMMDAEKSIWGAAIFDRALTMWGATLLFGTNGADLTSSDGIALDLTFDTDQLSGVCEIEGAGGTYTRANILITRENGPPLTVEQETFAPNVSEIDRVMLVRYTFTNNTTTPVNGLRAGLYVDWDVRIDTTLSISSNYTRFNADLMAAEVYQAGQERAGIAGVNVPITSYRGFGVMGRMSKQDFFDVLAGGLVDAEPIGPEDVTQVIGFGPFSIAPGASQSVMFVITAGYSEEDFAAAVAAGRAVADAFPRRVITVD